MNTKKSYFKNTSTKTKTQNSHETSAYSNAFTIQKSVAVYFKDVKTEEKFINQYQKLVETTSL